MRSAIRLPLLDKGQTVRERGALQWRMLNGDTVTMCHAPTGSGAKVRPVMS